MRTEYKNLNGDSGIISYELKPEAIDVEFTTGGVYTYTKASVGEENFAVMTALAIVGAGLNGFINKHVRYKYISRNPDPTPPLSSRVNVNIRPDEAVAVVSELLKNYDVTLSVS